MFCTSHEGQSEQPCLLLKFFHQTIPTQSSKCVPLSPPETDLVRDGVCLFHGRQCVGGKEGEGGEGSSSVALQQRGTPPSAVKLPTFSQTLAMNVAHLTPSWIQLVLHQLSRPNITRQSCGQMFSNVQTLGPPYNSWVLLTFQRLHVGFGLQPPAPPPQSDPSHAPATTCGPQGHPSRQHPRYVCSLLNFVAKTMRIRCQHTSSRT